jgi:outer membrane protein assembly factor BamB
MTRIVSGAVILVGCQLALAADFEQEKANYWHHWRGPDATGFSATANPPVRWGANDNIKWKLELPGRGSSTPVVWGDNVFVLVAVKTDRVATPAELPKRDPKFQTKTEPPTHFYKFIVLCVDRNSGNIRWQKTAAERVPHEGHHETHSYAGGSPTTDGQYLYASFGSYGTYCYDFNGNLKWARELGPIHSRLGWGEAVTPVIVGRSLLINYDQEADSILYCLDAGTGETRWAAKRDEKTSWNTPLVVEHGGVKQVITNGTNRIRSTNLETGELIWSCGGMTTNAIPSPILYKDSVICMSGYKGAAVISIPLSSKGDLGEKGKVNWRYNLGTPYVPSPVLANDKLYFTSGNDAFVTVLDVATGKPVLEKERLPQVKSFYASPVAAAGRIYFTDRSGTTLVIKAGEGIDVLAANKLNETIDASPVLVGKQLFLRGEKTLYCIEEK